MKAGSKKPVAVVGAGIAGLTAAHYLKRNGIPVVLFEAGKQVGGMAKSYADEDGFSYDFGAHFVTNRLAAALGVSSQCRNVKYYGESVWLDGKSYAYPFGLMRIPRFMLGAVAAKARRSKAIDSAADWFTAAYGAPLANEVALPLLEAWSGAPATELAASVGGKMQNSIPWTIVLKLASRRKKLAVACGYSHEMSENPSVWHVYPDRGLSLLCEKILSEVSDVVEMESPVENILVESGKVIGVKVKGEIREVSAVVSTAPCPVLAKIVVGTDILKPLAEFKYRPMIFVNMRFGKRGLLSDTMVWTPGKEYPFFRLTETPYSMPWHAPEGKTLVMADIGCTVGDKYWTMDDEALGNLCLDAMEPFYRGIRKHYLGCRVLKTPMAYPVYLNHYEPARKGLEEGTGVEGLYSIGRNGEFAHLLMEDVYWRTLKKMCALTASLQAGGSARDVDESEQRIAA